MLFSERDMAALRLLCWCQYIRKEDINRIISETEINNLISLKLVKDHGASGALILSARGRELLASVYPQDARRSEQSYHKRVFQRKLRLSKLVLTAYQAAVNIFETNIRSAPALVLSSLSRTAGHNPWGSTRIAAIASLGGILYAVHYICPGIGKVALADELTAFTNQTARFRDARRAFLFAGESYPDILAELEQTGKPHTKLILYGDAYRCLQLPVHLLSCDNTGAVQLQFMSVPDYRKKLTQAALKNQYRPPPEDAPAWDALFQGLPFVMAADMDLRRVDAAICAAHEHGMKQIAIAALERQAEAVLFSRYRDTGLARVFVLTDDAISAVTGRPLVPYTPPRTQFITSKGDVVDAPPFQTRGKAGGSH